MKGSCEMNYAAIVMAAGRGTRTNLPYNKIFALINGIPCLVRALKLFIEDSECQTIYIPCQPNDIQQLTDMLLTYQVPQEKLIFVYGGNTRQESTFQALKEVRAPYVFIHDGARPFLEKKHLDALKKQVLFEKAAILGISMVDTMKEVDAFKQINKTLNRAKIYAAQTPQAFQTDMLQQAYKIAQAEKFEATDEAQLIEYVGNTKVQIVEGSKYNMKITTPEDIILAETISKILDSEERSE